jgi:hypothetical protein
MSACRWMFALGMVCIAAISDGQVSDPAVAARVLGAHWREISRASGMVFSGTVLSVEPQPIAKGQPLPVILTKLRVDRAIVGVARNQIVTVREWAGAWDTHRAMSAGERVLLFLYPPSRLGLTSPVGGRAGLVALDGRGEIVASYFAEFEPGAESEGAGSGVKHVGASPRIPRRAALGAPDHATKSYIPLSQLEREIRIARGH